MILPNQDRIVFKKIDIERKSKGGIILNASEVGEEVDVAYGKILYIGEGKYAPETGELVPMRGKIGDIIVFNPRMPVKWMYGQETWIIRDSDVLIFLRGEEGIEEKQFTDLTSDLKTKVKGRPMIPA